MRIFSLLPESIGDFLLTTPSLHSLQKAFPKDEHLWLLPPSLDEIASLVPLSARHARLDQRINPDITICFPPAAKFYKQAFALGGKRRLGYVHAKMLVPRLFSQICLTECWVCDSDSPLHELEAYGKILDFLHVPFQAEIPRLNIPEQNLAAAANWLKARQKSENQKIIALHLNERWPKNPLPYFEKIIHENLDALLVILFSQIEEEKAKRWMAEQKDERVVSPGVIPLAAYAAFLQQSDLLISVDSGPVHIASAVKTPVLVFYPKNNFTHLVLKWHPWGIPYQALPLMPEESLTGLCQNMIVQLLQKGTRDPEKCI